VVVSVPDLAMFTDHRKISVLMVLGTVTPGDPPRGLITAEVRLTVSTEDYAAIRRLRTETGDRARIAWVYDHTSRCRWAVVRRNGQKAAYLALLQPVPAIND
jgi:hypothetical protein